MHHLPVVGADETYSGPSATVEPEPEAEAVESSEDSSSLEEPELSVEDFR